MGLDVSKTIDPIQSAEAIEHLAIAMAAAMGIVWAKAHADIRTNYRIWANAALCHLGLEGRAKGLAAAKAALEYAVAVQRRAAAALDAQTTDGDLVVNLYKSASAIDMIAGMVDDPIVEEAV